jgi:uncharacterized OsmC-like protein
LDDGEFKVGLELMEGYRFRIDMNGSQEIFMDEPKPLGSGEHPNAGKFLAAAVGNCLCASLTFCVKRTHTEMLSLHAEVYSKMERNERGRLRITHIKVVLHPELSDPSKLKLCQDVFEDFCIVSQSVRQGIPTDVEIVTSGPVVETKVP